MKALVAAIVFVGKRAFDSVVDAIYRRWERQGFWAALRSALASLFQACAWRLDHIGAHPFHGVDWEAVLVSSPGVSRKAQESDFARMRGRYYYRFDGVQHFMTAEKFARAGGFPIFDRAVIGRDRTSHSWVTAIPLQCGGSAGVLVVAVFAESDEGPKLVGVIQQGDKQRCFFSHGALHVSTPVRDPDEPNCSWRRTRVARYFVSSEAVRKAREVVLTTVHFDRAFKHALSSQRYAK